MFSPLVSVHVGTLRNVGGVVRENGLFLLPVNFHGNNRKEEEKKMKKNQNLEGYKGSTGL